jgi:predicted enzyme related to lactoylglutathione lyase
MRQPQEGAPPQWLSYVAVESADAAAQSAAALGARTLKPPTDIPGIGRFAVLQDPTGAVFAVFQR